MAIELTRPVSKWNQLTYTSADSVSGTQGGWGIKEISPDVPEASISQLRKGVTTRLVEVVETSQFASDDQLRARPRRLTFREVNGVPMLWHAASAGPDATGRPGNVFTHAAELVSRDPGLRPIEYWRSDDWLAPFGASDVTAARLAELRPGAVVTRESVTAFVRESDRLYCLEWMLAAVSHVMQSRKSMVLATDTPDEAALWLGAISFLTAPALARRISWTTFERAGGVKESAAQGLTVICVPRVDLETLLEPEIIPGILVVDPTWALDDPVDGTWKSKAGQTFPADPFWQSGMLDLFALKDAKALRVLAGIDGLAGMVDAAAAARLPPHWPLSVALLSDGKGGVDRRLEVIEACLAVAPTGVLESPGIKRLINELVADPDTTALDRLVRTPGLSDDMKDAASVAASIVYVSGGWRSGGVPPTLSPHAAERVKKTAAKPISVAIGQAQEAALANQDQLMAAAGLVSFLLTNDLDPPPLSDHVPAPVSGVVDMIKARLVEARIDVDRSKRPWLHAALFRANQLSRPRQPPTAPPPSPTAPDKASAPTGQGHYAASQARPPMFSEASRTVTAPATANAAQAPDAALKKDMADLLDKATMDSDRAKAIAQCLLLANGIASVALRQEPATLDADRSRAVRLLVAQDTSPAFKRHIKTWLGVYWAIQESRDASREPTLKAEAPPQYPVPEMSDQSELLMSELSAFMQEASVDRAAQLLCAALVRDIAPRLGSLLAISVPGTSKLGWSAVQQACKTMTRERTLAILAAAKPTLMKHEVTYGRHWVLERIRVIEPATGQGEGSMPLGPRGK